MNNVKPKATLGLVGGSDLNKIAEQMGGMDGIFVFVIKIIITDLIKCNFFFSLMLIVLEKFDYVFAENGLVAYKNGKLIGRMVINDFLFIFKCVFY